MTSSLRHAPSSVRSKIYHTLYDAQEFCSKQMLAARCGISMPTLYQNLNELMEEGLVQYSGEEKSTGGRRAQGLDIIPDARLAVGIAVSEHRLRFVLTDLRLRELAYQAIPFDFVSSLSGETSSLPGFLEAFLDAHQVDRGKLLGVGIIDSCTDHTGSLENSHGSDARFEGCSSGGFDKKYPLSRLR